MATSSRNYLTQLDWLAFDRRCEDSIPSAAFASGNADAPEGLREVLGTMSSAMNTILPPKDLSLTHFPDGRPPWFMKKSRILLQNAITANSVAATIGTHTGVAPAAFGDCGIATAEFIPGRVTCPERLLPVARSVNCTMKQGVRVTSECGQMQARLRDPLTPSSSDENFS